MVVMKLATESERTRWIAFVQAQPLPLDVEAKPWRKSRSNEQNALLWAMYGPLADHMGYDRDDIHEWMCGRFFGWRDIKVPKTPRNPEGLASMPVRSTTRDENGKRNVIDKTTFTKFVDMVERVAAQAGVFIPMERAA
ncbi:MAG TPA: hypothetical protein VFP92_10710 [Rhodanobacteraceae bacterium]|nr:hypothetical protein [Rhodanobacteraceae bacterium]